MHSPTHYRFRHQRGGQLIWASEVGEVDIEVGSGAYQRLLADQPYTGNALADEGEEDILDVYFRGATAPTSFYLMLFNDTPAETDTLTTLTGEVTGTGYAREAVARNGTDWPVLATDSGDFQVEMLTKQFEAAGTWTAANHAGLCTASTGTSGLLIAYVALSTTRTLVGTDTLDVDLAVKLS